MNKVILMGFDQNPIVDIRGEKLVALPDIHSRRP